MSSGLAILGLASGVLVLSSAALLWSANTTSNSLAKTPFRDTNSPVIVFANSGGGISQWENFASPPLEPGTYKTSPSLGIVIVPDASIDPMIIRNPIDCDPRMPKANLELNFVQWQAEAPSANRNLSSSLLRPGGGAPTKPTQNQRDKPGSGGDVFPWMSADGFLSR